MPIQHSPPARQTRPQARAQASPTEGPFTPNLKGAEPSRKEGRGPRRLNSFSGVFGRFPGLSRTTFKGAGEEGEEKEEESDCTEGFPAPVGASQGTGGPTLAQYNQPFSHHYEPSLLAIMQQMARIMANI
ncbi:hypothetical protein O181_031792 [Austropuccinia psidii MF-1]|uniref:Uncharacterized protein n=1 Tax=Austropuccinia psidii MF-1 TaxID=1389203 RepID=A0A9Q3D1D3_9BASI|nr:hypothetical protein [Austropuccinia psidii MF-1]